MNARGEIEKLIEKKRVEIDSLQKQLEAANNYVLGLQDALKKLPKEDGGDASESAIRSLRPGTDLFKAWEILRKLGRPLHITELLQALNKPIERKTRAGLTGSLGFYVREGKIFTRPAPNTFGLLEFEKPSIVLRAAEILEDQRAVGDEN